MNVKVSKSALRRSEPTGMIGRRPSRKSVLLWSLTSVICGVATGRAYAQPNTVLVNGFNTSPPVPWMSPGQPCPCPPEFETIAGTYGAPPIPAYWLPNFNVFPPLYFDMVASGRYQVANVLGSLPPGDVNLIAHSHGGNVAIMATYLAPRRLRHLINLATPINWDLPGLLGGGADSRCQISSTADWVQFAGASPYQVLNFVYAIYYAIEGAIQAFQALLAGDYVAAYEYFSRSVFEVIDAEYWWLTTKVEVEGPTYMFTGLGHSELHEPPVWNAIRNVCATN